MRFIALGPLFFFFRRAAVRSDLESFGAEAISRSIPLASGTERSQISATIVSLRGGLIMSLRIRVLLFTCVGLTAGAAMLAQSRPGDMTQSRVWIENRLTGDAIPVVVQNTGAPARVLVTGTPSVTVESANTLPTRLVRQSWEYRTIVLPAGQDPASLLVAAGNDGWEAVAVLQPSQPSASLLLKRPR
jgi:hypothetical protein